MTTQQHKEILYAIALLGDGLRELRADNATLHADNATIHGELRELHADNATIHGELRELHADNATIHGELRELHADNATIHREQNSLRTVLANLVVTMNARFDVVDTRFSRLESKVDQSSDHLTAQIDRVHQELSGRIGDLEPRSQGTSATR